MIGLRVGKSSTQTESSGRASPRLVLVRHGQASLGGTDYDRLSPTGQRQGRRLRQRLAPVLGAGHAIWSGTLKRHRQTLAAFAHESDIRLDAALNEFQTFHLIRSAVNQAGQLGLHAPSEREFADPRANLHMLLEWFPSVLVAWQEGRLSDDDLDDWDSFRRRVLSPVGQWRDLLASGSSIVVVTSAGVISTLIAELGGYGLGVQRDLAVKLYNASISELQLDDGCWRVARINCIEHLDDPRLRTLA